MLTIRPFRTPRGTLTGKLIAACSIKPLPTEVYAKLSAIPGYRKWEGREIAFRPVSASIRYILQNWPESEWLEGSDEHLKEFVQSTKEAEKVSQMKAGGKLPKDGFVYKLPPYEHQRRAFLLSRDKRNFALLMEQRTGKTKVTIDNAAYLWKKGEIDTLIVISVNGVHRNWIDNEVPKHIPDWVKYQSFFLRPGDTLKQKKKFEKTLTFAGLRIFAFNVEGFSRIGRCTEMFEEALGDGKRAMIVVDESTRIKTPDANRTKYLIKTSSKAKYRRILTGTPVTKSPVDLYAQFAFLDKNIIGFDTLTSFRARYCEIIQQPILDSKRQETGRTFDQIIGYRNLDELTRLIDGHSFRVLRKDCMDLPPKVYKRWPVEMSAEQKRLYKTLRDEYIADFEGSTVAANLVMTRLLRLQQITCGWWPMEEGSLLEGETWNRVKAICSPNPRITALMNILEETEDKVIIWARFRPDLKLIEETIREAYGKESVVSYHGGIKPEERARAYKSFQESDKVRYFVANQASAGLGLALTKAGTHIYYSNSYDLEQRLQSEDRAEAPGKKDSTLIIDIECPGTSDSKIIQSLRNKKGIADMITKDPKSLFLEEDNDN